MHTLLMERNPRILILTSAPDFSCHLTETRIGREQKECTLLHFYIIFGATLSFVLTSVHFFMENACSFKSGYFSAFLLLEIRGS
jgi:hypothetical protein